MGKNGVDGVYDGDPRLDPSASFLPELTHRDAIERGLEGHGHDGALALHGERPADPRLRPDDERNIERLVRGERIGTRAGLRRPRSQRRPTI